MFVEDRADAKLVQEGIAILVVVNNRKMRRKVEMKCLIYTTQGFR